MPGSISASKSVPCRSYHPAPAAVAHPLWQRSPATAPSPLASSSLPAARRSYILAVPRRDNAIRSWLARPAHRPDLDRLGAGAAPAAPANAPIAQPRLPGALPQSPYSLCQLAEASLASYNRLRGPILKRWTSTETPPVRWRCSHASCASVLSDSQIKCIRRLGDRHLRRRPRNHTALARMLRLRNQVRCSRDGSCTCKPRQCTGRCHGTPDGSLRSFLDQ